MVSLAGHGGIANWAPDRGLGAWIGGKAQARTRMDSASSCGQLNPVVSSLILLLLLSFWSKLERDNRRMSCRLRALAAGELE